MIESKQIRANNIKQYLEESKSLERDYISEILTSRKNAWRICMVFAFLCLVALISAVIAFKRDPLPPIVLRVDNATGAVDIITTMRESELSYGEIVDSYFLNRYVLNRESYDYYNIQMLYDATALLSSPNVQAEYYEIFKGENARDQILQDHTRIIVTIRSITPIKEGKAVVRFTTQEKALSGEFGTLKNLIATITYKYVNAPMKLEDRLINPLGFQVTSYRVDPEKVPN